MTATKDQLLDQEFYLKKTYCKTASLMANSAKSVAVLSGQSPEVCETAEGYGRHLGLAFQVLAGEGRGGSSSMPPRPCLACCFSSV